MALLTTFGCSKPDAMTYCHGLEARDLAREAVPLSWTV